MDDDQRPEGPAQPLLLVTALGSALLALLVLVLCCGSGVELMNHFIAIFTGALTDPDLT